jgi:hypothetical protein
MTRESNPPLYYSLLRGWIALFGDADRVLRSLSIAIGLGGIAAAWAAARRLGGAFAGLAAAALLAVAAAHVDASQEVRGYILADSAALVATWGMIAYLDRPRASALTLYAVGALAALYSHTTMAVFVLLANLAMIGLLRRDRPALAGWLGANAFVAILWSWWGWISLAQARAPQSNFGWIARPGLGDALTITERAYLPGYLSSGGIGAGLLLAALAVCLGWFMWRDRRPAVIMFGGLALGAPIVLFAISLSKPILLVRTLYWASGPVVILVAVALASMASRRIASLALATLLLFEIVMLVHWLPARQQEGWKAAVQSAGTIAPHGVLLVEGDAVALAAMHYHPLAPGVRIVALRPPPGSYDHWADGLFAGPHVDTVGAAKLLHDRRQLFALVRGDHDPGRVLRDAGRGRVFPQASDNRQPWLWVWNSATR